jgi:hypothetical protein
MLAEWAVTSCAVVIASAQQVTIDFRNRIPGILDAPVFEPDGVTRLTDQGFWVQLAYREDCSPGPLHVAGVPASLQSGTNAGYWMPQQVELPGIVLGQCILVEVRAFMIIGGWEERSELRVGGSKTLSLMVTNSVMPLLGLLSFSLQPESLSTERMGNEVIVRWNNQGAGRYELQATQSLKPPVSWIAVFNSTTNWGVGFGGVFAVTNGSASPYRFFRLQRWR